MILNAVTLFLWIVFSSWVFAAPMEIDSIKDTSLLKVKSSRSSKNIPQKKSSVDIELGYYGYSSSKVEPNHVEGAGSYKLRYRSSNDSSFKFDLGVYGTGEPESLPNPVLKNAYYFNPLKPINMGVSLGLKKVEWSEWDSRLHWGQWNPKLSVNQLRPEEQGAFGAFIENYKSDWKFKVGFTPLYIPDMGAQFKIKSGEMLSGNRWFQNPVTGVFINNVETPVEYELADLEYDKILLNYGIWVQFGYKPKKGYFGQVSLAHKPMNQLVIQVEKPLVVTDEKSGSSIPVVIHPKVLMHNLVTLEAGYKGTQNSFFYSASYDQPVQDPVEEGFQQQDLYIDLTQSALVYHKLSFIGLPRSKVFYGLWHREDSLMKNASIDSSSTKYQIDINIDRYPLGSSGVFGMESKYRAFGSSGQAEFRYIRSSEGLGHSLLFGLKQSISPRFWVVLEGDVISSLDKGRDEDNFYNKFQNNDRWYAGVKYVF